MAKDDTLSMHNPRQETTSTNTEKPLKTAVDELTAITKQLRRLSFMIIMITLFNIFWSGVASYILILRHQLEWQNVMLGFHAGLLLSCLLLLWQYDNLRRVGDSLFEEISDELQWYILKKYSSPDSEDEVISQRPPINERVILRQYALTTKLPLTNYGLGIINYAVVNILIWLFITLTLFERIQAFQNSSASIFLQIGLHG
jgi:hypothetical protein